MTGKLQALVVVDPSPTVKSLSSLSYSFYPAMDDSVDIYIGDKVFVVGRDDADAIIQHHLRTAFMTRQP